MCELIGHLHAKNPDKRYGSAKEVSELLAQCAIDLQEGRLPEIPDPTKGAPDVAEESPGPVSKVVRPTRSQLLVQSPLLKVAAAVLVLLGALGITEVNGVTKVTTSVIRIVTAWGTVEIIPKGPNPDIVLGPRGEVTIRPGPGTETPTSPTSPSPAAAPPPAIAPFDSEQARQHQQAWADYLGVPVEHENSIGMKFRLIPPGEFLMGSTPEQIEAALKKGYQDPTSKIFIRSEGPQHQVVLTHPVYVSVTEVTQSQYEQVMDANPSAFSAKGQFKAAVNGLDTSKHQVEMVRWKDAAEFCANLSQQEQLKPYDFRSGKKIVRAIEGTGYRLPTEAEWEFACRAGTTTNFWSGDQNKDLSAVGWYRKNVVARTHAAGKLEANPFGLFDVHGNVWEWVQDGWDAAFYRQFTENAAVDPSRPYSADSPQVFRGGSAYDVPASSRSSHRFTKPLMFRSSFLGFRVVLPVDVVKKPTGDNPALQAKEQGLRKSVRNSSGSIPISMRRRSSTRSTKTVWSSR